MRRIAVGGMAFVALLLAPAPVAAHALVGRLESPLPLAAYLTGAALAVALSFVFVIARDVRAPRDADLHSVVMPRALAFMLRAIGLVAWIWIVAQAIAGGSSDADVATLFLWVYGWVAVAIVSALFFPVWTWLDPFVTLHDILAWVLARFGVRGWEAAPYPMWLASWPAVAGLAFVAWLELAYRGAGLGVVLVGYTALTLLGMAQFGRDAWSANGETFSVWFGTLNLLAPYGAPARADELRTWRRPFGVGLLGPGWTTSHVVLVAIGTGSILYDGLSQTGAWFGLFGLPSLPGATILLAGFLAILVAVVLAVGRVVGLPAVGAGLVPIAVGYLIAHYATYLLGDGQRIVVAISDPLQLGWDLFGTAFYEASTAWIPPVALWTVMLVAVVGGHILGAWSGHVAAVRDASPGSSGGGRASQLPLAVLMVALTAVTLWSLGQVVVKEPVPTTSNAVVDELSS